MATSTSSSSCFLSLSEDVLLTIICTTTPLDTLALSQTCTLLRRLANLHVVWVRLYDLHVLKKGLADTLGRSTIAVSSTLNPALDEDESISTQFLIRETVASYTLAQRWRTVNKDVANLRNSPQGTFASQFTSITGASPVTSPFTSLPPNPTSFTLPAIPVQNYRPIFTPLQLSHIVPTLTSDLTSNPTFIKFIDIGDVEYSGRLVLTVSRVIWLVVQVWDIGSGARREGLKKTVSDKGKGRVVGEEALGEVGGINEQVRGDVLEGSAEEDEDVVAKNCLCQWSARGASFSGIVVNQEGDKDGTVAIGLLQDGRHHIQILKLTPPSSSSSAWSLNQVFTLSNITMDMYPVSLIGTYLCVANARDRTEIINWKKNQRGVLKGDDGLANGGLQYNKCSQVLLIPETSTILVIRARSINLFKWPQFYPVDDLSFSAPQNMHTNDLHLGLGSLLATSAPTSADAQASIDSSSADPSPPNSTSITSAPQPAMQPRSTLPLTIPRPEIEQSIASYSFGWVDCITATIARAPPSAYPLPANPSIKAVPKPIYIFFRGTLDDPWANDDTKLEMWVIEGNPDWDSSFSGVEEGNDNKHEDASAIPLSARDSRRHSVSSGDHGPANPPILNISSSPTTQTSNLGQSTAPYLFPPTPLPSLSIPTPRGPLLCPTLILGPSMTAVWIEPKERMGRVAGMVVDYPGLSAVPGPMNQASTSNMHGNVNVALGGGTRAFGINDDIGPRRTRGSKYGSSGPRDEVVDRWREQQRRKREKMVVVAFPGPFYGGDERTSSSSASTSTSTYPSLDTNLGLPSASASTTTSAPKPLQLIYNSSPSNWSAIDYDEDRGRVAVASSVRGFVVVDL